MTPAPANDRAFAGAIPAFYDRFMVPLLFAPFADDLAARVAAARPKRVLEVAAGTGVLTRRLSQVLPEGTTIVATDLAPPMLEEAQRIGTARPVRWQAADAQALPFDDASFDVVACQFGAMFFPDKVGAFAQARRVLRTPGLFVFSVWDALAHNDFARAVEEALATLFPHDPPRFMSRTPHGYHDPGLVREHLAGAGFTDVDVQTVTLTGQAPSAHDVALALCQGTPLRGEILARDAARLDEVTDACAQWVARRLGDAPATGRLQAHVVQAWRRG